MASGIEVHPSSLELFDLMKQKKVHRYVFFKIEKANPTDKHPSIVPDLKGPPSTPISYAEDVDMFDEMKATLLEMNQPRYILYDFHHIPEDGSLVNRLTFIAWVPDTAPVKPKMLYASSRDYCQKAFHGLNKYHQCNDAEALSFKEILSSSGRKV